MNATYHNSTTWLRTDNRVFPLNASMCTHLAGVQTALHHGVIAVADASRPGFYEIEIGGKWYYIHIPNGSAQVYLVAARREAPESSALRGPAPQIPLAV